MMMSQIAEVLDARLYGSDVKMTGVSKDTRDIHHGDLYVALVGERFDGHSFVQGASSAGAAGALVSELQSGLPARDFPQVQVKDTRIALGQLASYWRNVWKQYNIAGRLIGITGSNGKTSVKEMCRKILADYAGLASVLATRGNLNNDIGLPLMLLELRERHRYAVLEMGANHTGEIDYLTAIARPDVAVLNNAGPAHLEGFGSLQNVAAAKAEIFNGLSEDGVAIINRDDAFSSYWVDYCNRRCSIKSMISFSRQNDDADVYVKSVSDDCYQVVALNESAELTLKVPGEHNVMNALAAIAATRAIDVPLQSIVGSLSQFENINGRLTVVDAGDGLRIIDDTYNANPSSVSAAIDVLASMQGETVLVLGDMAELGENTEQMHADVGRKAKAAGIDHLYATGEYSVNAVKAFGDNGVWCEDKTELTDMLQNNLPAGAVVLVKGSRKAAMEEVVEKISTRNNYNKRVN